MPRYLHTIYCDDVRLEVGNKQSLMGIYSNELIVPAFPVQLPKLCIVVTLVTPIDNPLTELTIKITKDNEPLVEVPIPGDQLAQPQQQIIENGDKSNPERRIALNLNLMIAPFSAEKECELRVRAITENGELKGGGLKVKAGPQSQPA